jgi:hypothetical protein
VEASGFEFVSLRGKANYNYLRPDEYFPDRNSLPPGPEFLNLTFRALFSEPLVDQHRGLEELLRTRSIDLIVIDTLFFGAFPLLLGPRNQRPPILCCGVNPMFLTGFDAGPTAPPAKTAAERETVQQANREFLETFEPFAVRINEKLREIGSPLLPAPPLDCVYTLPDLFLQFSVPEFEFAPSDRPSTVHFVGPILPKTAESFEEPPWWGDLDNSRPIVLVTQGTLANTDLTELIEPTLAALTDEDVLVIAATGDTDATISAVPRNARVARFIPFDQLFLKHFPTPRTGEKPLHCVSRSRYTTRSKPSWTQSIRCSHKACLPSCRLLLYRYRSSSPRYGKEFADQRPQMLDRVEPSALVIPKLHAPPMLRE